MSQNFTDDSYSISHVGTTDLQNMENNFTCLKTSFSGANEPSNIVPGMYWFDTTGNLLKIRDEADTAWLSIWDLANNKPLIANLSNEITNTMCAAALKDPIAATAGLRTIGTGAQQAAGGSDSRFGTVNDDGVTTAKLLDGAVTLEKMENYAAGDILMVSDDTETEKSCQSNIVTIFKEAYITRGGTLRIKFDAEQKYINGHAQIYRNGTAVGTIQDIGTSYATYSEDISGWSATDLVRVYMWRDGGPNVSDVKNFRLYSSRYLYEAYTNVV